MLANDEFQHEILVIEMRTLVIFFLKKKKLGLICSDDYRVKHKKKPQLISFDFLQKLDRDCDFFLPVPWKNHSSSQHSSRGGNVSMEFKQGNLFSSPLSLPRFRTMTISSSTVKDGRRFILNHGLVDLDTWIG